MGLGCDSSPNPHEVGNDVERLFPGQTDLSTEAPASAPSITLICGTNPTGSTDPDGFIPLSSGDILDIEWGFQGQPMAVLAVQSLPNVDEPVDIIGSFVMSDMGDSEVGASVYYKKKKLVPSEAGGFYFNLFMITGNYHDYVDRVGLLQLSVVDSLERTLGLCEVSLSLKAP